MKKTTKLTQALTAFTGAVTLVALCGTTGCSAPDEPQQQTANVQEGEAPEGETEVECPSGVFGLGYSFVQARNFRSSSHHEIAGYPGYHLGSYGDAGGDYGVGEDDHDVRFATLRNLSVEKRGRSAAEGGGPRLAVSGLGQRINARGKEWGKRKFDFEVNKGSFSGDAHPDGLVWAWESDHMRLVLESATGQQIVEFWRPRMGHNGRYWHLRDYTDTELVRCATAGPPAWAAEHKDDPDYTVAQRFADGNASIKEREALDRPVMEGEYCDDDGCYPKKQNGSGCRGDDQCESNVCTRLYCEAASE